MNFSKEGIIKKEFSRGGIGNNFIVIVDDNLLKGIE